MNSPYYIFLNGLKIVCRKNYKNYLTSNKCEVYVVVAHYFPNILDVITVVKLSCEDVFETGDFVLPVLVVNVKNVNKPYFKNFGIKQRHLPGIHVQFTCISLFFKNAFLQLQRLNAC
jgi:hypothetical protein